MSPLHYLPLPLAFFTILVGLFILLVIVIEVGLLRYAYMRLGISSRMAFLLLLASLAGSYLNLPLFDLPAKAVVSGRVIDFFGMRYVIPSVVDWPATTVAVNVGGAVIPGLMSLYLLIKNRLWVSALIATAGVALVVHLMATPVPGLGIAVPIFVPALATAIVSLVLSREQAAPLAYISGSMGTLIGADLLNLGRVQGLGAPVVSIGGAGTFDGIFITGILAVLIASLTPGTGPKPKRRRRKTQ